MNRAMLGSSQCDSVSLFGAGRGGVLQAAGAGDLQPANHCSQRAQPASRGNAGTAGTAGTKEKEVKRDSCLGRREAAGYTAPAGR